MSQNFGHQKILSHLISGRIQSYTYFLEEQKMSPELSSASQIGHLLKSEAPCILCSFKPWEILKSKDYDEVSFLSSLSIFFSPSSWCFLSDCKPCSLFVVVSLFGKRWRFWLWMSFACHLGLSKFAFPCSYWTCLCPVLPPLTMFSAGVRWVELFEFCLTIWLVVGALVADSVTCLPFNFIITSELLCTAIFLTSAMLENPVLLQWR